RLARLDEQRRVALEALVTGSSRLQHALTAEETEAIIVGTANQMFGGRETRLELAPATAEDAPSQDVGYDPATCELRIPLCGQAGILGAVTTVVEIPDSFLFEVARLYSHHVGTRLEQLRVINALTDAATRDALTGIDNRRGAQAQLAFLEGGDAVFILDLDHFKAINDSLGHQTGDQVLADFGDYLRSATRPADAVARYGGEEFLVICRQVTPDIAAAIASRLLDGWRSRRPVVTFSVGYAMHESESPPEVTVEHADMALYEAKREGRDQARAYVPWHPTATSSHS
ncbi:MAG TPA: GGDEF domain-containing protein, partial [Acidimicrobiia bacterium]|nr:GGDEF domain-containing protein [Acidimicrobiia bacterium]